jgi:hypothetical protein
MKKRGLAAFNFIFGGWGFATEKYLSRWHNWKFIYYNTNTLLDIKTRFT